MKEAFLDYLAKRGVRVQHLGASRYFLRMPSGKTLEVWLSTGKRKQVRFSVSSADVETYVTLRSLMTHLFSRALLVHLFEGELYHVLPFKLLGNRLSWDGKEGNRINVAWSPRALRRGAHPWKGVEADGTLFDVPTELVDVLEEHAH